MERICKVCGNIFIVKGGTRSICFDCEVKQNTAICEICGETFIKKSKNQLACGSVCAAKLGGRRQAGRKRSQESVEKQRKSIKSTIAGKSDSELLEWRANIRKTLNTDVCKKQMSEDRRRRWAEKSDEEKEAFREKCRESGGRGTAVNEQRRQTCINNQKSYSEEKLRVFYEAGVKGAKASGNRFRTYGTSKLEDDVNNWMLSLGVEFERNNRDVLSGKEIDFYFPEYKFGIEFNGNWYHSVQGIMKLDSKYSTFSRATMKHQEKSLLCRSKGIHLLHIWEWEWVDERIRNRIKSQILGVLGRSRRVFARKCTSRRLSSEEAKSFFDLNCEFGSKSTLFSIGLFEGNTLLMAFGVGYKQTGRGVDSSKLEICRSATVLNTVVVGGSSKLLSALREEISRGWTHIKELHYFVDFDKHTGSSLEAMGFRFIKVTAPTLRIMFHSTVVLRGKEFLKGKVYSRQGSLHSEVMEEDERGNLSTFANAGTLHFVFDL